MVLGLSRLYFDWISDAGQKWLALRNLRNALPAVLLFVALLLLPQDRLRGAIVSRTRERFHVPTMPPGRRVGRRVLVAVVFMLQKLMSDSAVISLGDAMGLALLAISLVLLTGYAGEINLAIFTFAGIALITAWQFDVGPGGLATQDVALGAGDPAGNAGVRAGRRPDRAPGAAAARVCTSAWPRSRSASSSTSSSSCRPSRCRAASSAGSFTREPLQHRLADVPRPHWFGIDFTDQRNFLMLMTVVFALIGIGLIALRRSAYGRMIVAMKDSPAACATLGLEHHPTQARRVHAVVRHRRPRWCAVGQPAAHARQQQRLRRVRSASPCS